MTPQAVRHFQGHCIRGRMRYDGCLHHGWGTGLGITHVEVEVAGTAAPNDGEMLSFLLDSGAVHPVVPAEILERLGVEPLDVQVFMLADGTKVTRRKGGAVFRYDRRVGGANVIFGEPGDSVLLGVTTLEPLGLALDPLRQELHPLPMVL